MSRGFDPLTFRVILLNRCADLSLSSRSAKDAALSRLKPGFKSPQGRSVTWPSGKASVCKTEDRRFDSGRHLHALEREVARATRPSTWTQRVRVPPRVLAGWGSLVVPTWLITRRSSVQIRPPQSSIFRQLLRLEDNLVSFAGACGAEATADIEVELGPTHHRPIHPRIVYWCGRSSDMREVEVQLLVRGSRDVAGWWLAAVL